MFAEMMMISTKVAPCAVPLCDVEMGVPNALRQRGNNVGWRGEV